MKDNSNNQKIQDYSKCLNLSNTINLSYTSRDRKESIEKSQDYKYGLENDKNIDYSIISNDEEKSLNFHINLDETILDEESHTNSINKTVRSTNISNPALKILNHSKFSSDVLKHLNAARSNPSQFAGKLEKILKEDLEISENGCILYINNYPVKLSEGQKAFKEAIKFLKRQKPLPVFKTKDGMRRSAEDLVNIIILNDGKDEVISEKLAEVYFRMNKYGVAVGELKEMIEYGTFNPEYVVISLILCDGDLLRTERNIIFSRDCFYATVDSGLLPSDIIFTVVNLAEHYFEQGAVIPEFIVDKYKVNPKFIIGKVGIPDMNDMKSCSSNNRINELIFNTNTLKSTKTYKQEKSVSAKIEHGYSENLNANRSEYITGEKDYVNDSSNIINKLI